MACPALRIRIARLSPPRILGRIALHASASMTEMKLPAALVPLRDGQTPSEASVRYRSRGVVLVVGDDASAVDVARGLPPPLRAVVFAPGASGALNEDPRVVGGHVTKVEGHLGAFRARARGKRGEEDIGAFSHNEEGLFDLVLDLRKAPLIDRSVPPYGYFAPGPAAQVTRRSLEPLAGMVGWFVKPRYYSYEPEICAHASRGVPGCSRCLSACPAGAIRSAGDRVAVDSSLCQGCAACTLACPTGALSFLNPSRAEGLAMLDAAVRSGAERFSGFSLVVHAGADREKVLAASAGRPWVLLEFDPLPAFGEELWVTALAHGARRVVLVRGQAMPPEGATVVDARVAAMNDVLGMPPEERVRSMAPNELASLAGEPGVMPLSGRRVRLDSGSKRGLLHDTLGRIGPRPKALAIGAVLGTIHLERGKCTLCSGCANVCPTGAVGFKSVPVAELSFVEEACIQCGLCARACPEGAISLEARWADEETRSRARALVTDEPARCPACGAAFASRKLLDASLARFGPELGLAREDLDRLRLCPACRQESMFRRS